MDTGRISARYAKALYEYAVENNQDTAIYEEMKLVSESLFAVPEICKALLNPVISTEKRRSYY